jgi:hypothetical protein
MIHRDGMPSADDVGKEQRETVGDLPRNETQIAASLVDGTLYTAPAKVYCMLI